MSELLERSVSGDEDALRELVAQYHDRVYRFGRAVCRDGFDADDAVQEAFTTLARRPDVQRSPSVLGWLLTVVRNACLGVFRAAAGRQPLSETADVVDEQPSVEDALQRYELVTRVHRAIGALDADARAVLLLRDVEGLSGEEAARRLGLTLAAMKTRLHRARCEVRERVGNP